MQLSQNSPIYRCQGQTETGEQCPLQAVGYRRNLSDGDLYHACRDHIHNKGFKAYKQNPPAPVFPAPGQTGQTSAGKNWR